MNKVLLIGVSVLGLFLSSEAYSSYCNMTQCCGSDESVFCPNSTSDEVCTAGCGCCNDTTHEVVESSKKGYWNCCNKTTEEIYWNGSKALCCDGKKYKNGTDTEECCTGDKATNPTQKKVAVSGAPITGLETCCSISTYGPNPTAYWDGSSAKCCKGKSACLTEDGTKECFCCTATEMQNSQEKCEACNASWMVVSGWPGEQTLGCGGDEFCQVLCNGASWCNTYKHNLFYMAGPEDFFYGCGGGEAYCSARYNGSWERRDDDGGATGCWVGDNLVEQFGTYLEGPIQS